MRQRSCFIKIGGDKGVAGRLQGGGVGIVSAVTKGSTKIVHFAEMQRCGRLAPNRSLRKKKTHRGEGKVAWANSRLESQCDEAGQGGGNAQAKVLDLEENK